MHTLRLTAASILALLAGIGTARSADPSILVPGEPPLTKTMVEDYARFLEWQSGQALARAGGAERLAQLIINDWKNADGKGRQAFLGVLKWWREEYPKLSRDERARPVGGTTAADLIERKRQADSARAMYILMLQQAHDARLQTIQALSNISAKGHEVNMRIIDNMRPSGRYEYNPATGRYDRFVPR